jgi:hypothetical protein
MVKAVIVIYDSMTEAFLESASPPMSGTTSIRSLVMIVNLGTSNLEPDFSCPIRKLEPSMSLSGARLLNYGISTHEIEFILSTIPYMNKLWPA